MGTPSTGLPLFSTRSFTYSWQSMGVRRSKKKKKKVMDLSCFPHTPFLKNIDLYCQLVSLPRLWNLLFHELLCAALTHLLHTLTYMHTQAAPTLDLETTCSLPLPWKSKAPEPFISAPTPWALLLSTKLCRTSRVLYLKPLNSLMSGRSWESSSREETT